MFYLKEAIEIALSKEKSPPSIKAAMYVRKSPRGPEGVCRPATWQAEDHRGTDMLAYQAEVSDLNKRTVGEPLADGDV